MPVERSPQTLRGDGAATGGIELGAAVLDPAPGRLQRLETTVRPGSFEPVGEHGQVAFGVRQIALRPGEGVFRIVVTRLHGLRIEFTETAADVARRRLESVDAGRGVCGRGLEGLVRCPGPGRIEALAFLGKRRLQPDEIFPRRAQCGIGSGLFGADLGLALARVLHRGFGLPERLPGRRHGLAGGRGIFGQVDFPAPLLPIRLATPAR